MKHHRIHSTHGSALISAAIAAAILSIVAGTLLSYLSNEYSINYRSRIWNQALHLAEGGIEIGFAEINNQNYRGGSGVGFQSARGWSTTNISGNLVYQKTVTNFTNSAGGTVGDIAISVSNLAAFNPTVTSISTCPTLLHGTNIQRAVRASLYASSQFPAGFMAKNSIDMNGNNIAVDSYNSVTNYTNLGSPAYTNSAAYRNAHGNIASNGSVINSLSVGNADIYGDVLTGPGGTFAIGSNGSVGDTFVTANRATTVSQAESLGYVSHDFNVDYPDPILPSGASTWSGAPGNVTTGSGVGDITKPGTINGGTYRTHDIRLSSSDIIVINGNVSIYVLGDVSITGSAKITINANSSLTVYVVGSASMAGNGVANNAGYPIKNQWYGLSSSTSWSYTGNANWTGTIYAPQATVSFKGGGANGDASGAVVAKNIVLAGQTTFHYDESLRSSDTGAGYMVTTWIELRNVNGAWVP